MRAPTVIGVVGLFAMCTLSINAYSSRGSKCAILCVQNSNSLKRS